MFSFTSLASIFFLLGSSSEVETRVDLYAPCLQPNRSDRDLIPSRASIWCFRWSFFNDVIQFKTYVLSDLSCWSSKHVFLYSFVLFTMGGIASRWFGYDGLFDLFLI
ncbi:Uncharacterized protein Rs2_45849 [Raphanus sativus]|nr:Uncharacterized protein Rs2_45849 [Raphanus sativus]